MLRICVTSPDFNDASAFYRAVSPAAEMDRLGLIRYDLIKSAQWSDLIKYDVVLIHRPSEPTHLEFIKYAKSMRKKVWIDFDDDLTDPPKCNPSYGVKDRRVPIIQDCLALADLVTVSTEPLWDKFKWFNPNTHVIRNALDFNLLGPCAPQRPVSVNPTIAWRGGVTHAGDLALLDDVYEQFPDAKWLFFANPPANRPENSTVIPKADLVTYHRLLQMARPDVFVYPLTDHYFNHCKSNIAYLEAAWAGARVVGPNFPEWRGLYGCYLYEDGKIADSIRLALQLEPDPGVADFLQINYSLYGVAFARFELLKEITR